MSLKEKVDRIKAEALVLSTCFGLTAEQLQPVADAVKASDKLWDFPGYVNPTELEAAYWAINEAIEDVCLAHKIRDDQIEQMLP